MYEVGRHLEKKNRKRSWDIEAVEAKQYCMDKQESTSSSSCTLYIQLALHGIGRVHASKDTSMYGGSSSSYVT
jgi:hypothetical protein